MTVLVKSTLTNNRVGHSRCAIYAQWGCTVMLGKGRRDDKQTNGVESGSIGWRDAAFSGWAKRAHKQPNRIRIAVAVVLPRRT